MIQVLEHRYCLLVKEISFLIHLNWTRQFLCVARVLKLLLSVSGSTDQIADLRLGYTMNEAFFIVIPEKKNTEYTLNVRIL